MNKSRIHSIIRITASLVAILFGGVTVFVGCQTLFGFYDPGYMVFTPLLLFNTMMGILYIATGVMIWQNHAKALLVTLWVLLLNLSVLIIIGLLYVAINQVAFESIVAMIFRTAVWLLLFGIVRFIRKQ